MTLKDLDAATMQFGLGKYPKALRYLNRILSRDPRNTQAAILKASALSHLGNWQRGLEIINEVLAHRPDDYKALLAKAEICFGARKDKESLEIFARLARRPRIPAEEQRYLCWQWLNALIENRRTRTARAVLKRAMRRFPDDDMLSFYEGLLRNLPRSP